MVYTIGEAANMIGVNSSTLRYYDKEGLLPKVNRSEGGNRIFGEEDFVWLRLVNCLKASGMSIKDIKQFIDWDMQGDATIQKRLEMFYRQKAAVEAQMAQLQQTLDTVNFKCWYYEHAAKAGTTKALANLSDEDLPKDILALKNRCGLYRKCSK